MASQPFKRLTATKWVDKLMFTLTMSIGENQYSCMDHIAAELQRIGRPVVRQEFSFIPTIASIQDRMMSIHLIQQNIPAIELNSPSETITLADAIKAGLMDQCDMQTVLYTLKQIHDM